MFDSFSDYVGIFGIVIVGLFLWKLLGGDKSE